MNAEKDKRVGDRLYLCNCGRKCCYIMYEDLDAYCEAETKKRPSYRRGGSCGDGDGSSRRTSDRS